jgi:hypothetical protein
VGGELAARVVDQQLEAAELVLHLCEQGIDRLRIPDVHLRRDAAPAGGVLDQGLRLRQGLGPTAADRDIGAELCEQERDPLADPAASTGHDGALAREEVGAVDARAVEYITAGEAHRRRTP